MIQQKQALQKWVRTNIIFFLLLIGSIGSFNFFIDPLWCFTHKNFLQKDQKGFDERQQKINLIHFSEFNYDALLIGSSRVTLHNPMTLNGYKVFNLAADAMHPSEFSGYINYAKKINKKDFKVIFIGLDFQSISIYPSYQSAETYLKRTDESLYRYKVLFSYDTLQNSIKNIKYTLTDKKPFRTYDENHIARSHKESNTYVKQKVDAQIQDLSNKPLTYHRNEYIKALAEIKNANPNSKIVVFTTPLPEPILNTLLNVKKNQEYYNLWLHDIFNIFGPFYHFIYSNKVTNEYLNTFIDAGHYTTEVGNCINAKITNQSCKDPVFDNFGVLIQKNDDLDTILY